MDPQPRVLADPTAYADEPDGCTRRWRACGTPGVLGEVEGYRPFWAIANATSDIERQNDLVHYPRPLLAIADADDACCAIWRRHRLVHPGSIDDPPPRRPAKSAPTGFRPKRALKTRCDELAKIWVDKMAEKGPSSTS